jgi:hypothetical protein
MDPRCPKVELSVAAGQQLSTLNSGMDEPVANAAGAPLWDRRLRNGKTGESRRRKALEATAYAAVPASVACATPVRPPNGVWEGHPMRERRGCGIRRLTCAWRMAVGALAVCCGYNASVGTLVLAQAASNEQEVGMAHWGPTYVWLRVTDAGLVQVYASTGYRSAFVQPVTVTPSDLDRWASLLDELTVPTDARPASMTADATARGTDAEKSQVVLGGGDLVLEMETAVASESKLRVWVGATRPDAVVALVVPEAAADAAAMLREAARRARSAATATAAARAGAASAPAPATTTVAEPLAAPAAPVAVAASTSATASSAPLVESRDAPMSVVNGVSTTAQAPATAPPSDAASPLTTASQSAPLVSERTTTTVAGLNAPRTHPSSGHGARESALPVLRTMTTTKPMHVAASPLATVTTVNTAPQREHPHQRPAGTTSASRTSRSTGAAAPAEDVHGVDDATVQNLVGQWRPDLMYCYTQYGLREHTSLTGALVVRLALSPNGSVGHSVIGSRKWSGEGGSDVETCIRSRIAGWHFPPAGAGSIHSFNLQFAPGRS